MYRWPILVTFALIATASIAEAQPDARPRFEVASIRPNSSHDDAISMTGSPSQLNFRNMTVRMLIERAYDVATYRIFGAPAWTGAERFDIQARLPEGANSPERIRLMLQGLLEERFQLRIHRETRNEPVYALVVAKSGVKFKAAEESRCPPRPAGPLSGPLPVLKPGERPEDEPAMICGAFLTRNSPSFSSFNGRAVATDRLTAYLGEPYAAGRVVLDKTGLTGHYDISLEWTMDVTPESLRPGLFTALEEELGLKLQAGKGPGEVLVIDRVVRASEN